jgi:hypothetical protein
MDIRTSVHNEIASYLLPGPGSVRFWPIVACEILFFAFSTICLTKNALPATGIAIITKATDKAPSIAVGRVGTLGPDSAQARQYVEPVADGSQTTHPVS